MSKTLGAILTIGAAIAVNAIPGVGQFVSGALTASLGAGVAGAVTTAITIAGLNSLGGVLGLGPAADPPETTSTPLKIPRGDRTLIVFAEEELA